MRSILATPIGWRPTRPLLGYSGSITAISRDHGTRRSISARNFSRRVRFFFIAYSALAKLRWLMVVMLQFSMPSRMHGACRARRIDQHLPKHGRRSRRPRRAAPASGRPEASELRLWCLERSTNPEGDILSFTADDRRKCSYKLTTRDILAIAEAVLDDRRAGVPAVVPMQ